MPTPIQVQNQVASGVNSLTFSKGGGGTWTQNTTAGNALFLVLSSYGAFNWSLPTGWTSAAATGDNNNLCHFALFYRLNAPSISSIQVFIAGGVSQLSGIFLEYPNVTTADTSTPVTTINDAHLSGSLPTGTLTPNAAQVLLLACYGLSFSGSTSLSVKTPTNNFALESQIGGGTSSQQVAVALCDRTVVAVAAYSTAVTINTPPNAVSGDGTILAAFGATGGLGTTVPLPLFGTNNEYVKPPPKAYLFIGKTVTVWKPRPPFFIEPVQGKSAPPPPPKARSFIGQRPLQRSYFPLRLAVVSGPRRDPATEGHGYIQPLPPIRHKNVGLRAVVSFNWHPATDGLGTIGQRPLLRVVQKPLPPVGARVQPRRDPPTRGNGWIGRLLPKFTKQKPLPLQTYQSKQYPLPTKGYLFIGHQPLLQITPVVTTPEEEEVFGQLEVAGGVGVEVKQVGGGGRGFGIRS